jgi:hypothetical protein
MCGHNIRRRIEMRMITLMITSLGSYMQDAGYEGHLSDVDIRSANKADF